MRRSTISLCGLDIPVIALDTVVVGTGCAGYNAADWLYDLGRRDFAIVTEGVNMGTSRNTGSDKQTYYKLSLASDGSDSVREMAQTLFAGGGVNGDTALIEAACSVKSFMKLANLGVPFPTNVYGEYVGYKTDHDPRQRATSAGPLTSKYMTQCLERSVRGKNIRIFDQMQVVRLLADDQKIYGLLCLDTAKADSENYGFVLFACNHVIMATGGPAGVYENSVYPESQTGSTGLALEVGAVGANLHEWQYGLASVQFRWNVSGTYQQVLPKYIAVDKQGHAREFLLDYFDDPARALDMVFLKGYQWPFDVSKVHGSSMIDIIVHHEIFDLGNRVYMDFRSDPTGLENGFEALGTETYQYLSNSGALLKTPIARLQKMNPKAIKLYADHGIDLYHEPLQVSVCAQHNNGGLAVDMNWQTSLSGLYAAGEAAGTFGTYRPGGSALNSTQVGAMRAAEHIAYSTPEIEPDPSALCAVLGQAESLVNQVQRMTGVYGNSNVVQMRLDAQRRMSDAAAHIRRPEAIAKTRAYLDQRIANFEREICLSGPQEIAHMLKSRELLLAQSAVLAAIQRVCDEIGSKGSGLVIDDQGEQLLPTLTAFAFRPGKPGYEERILQTKSTKDGFVSEFVPVRPMPQGEDWFETVWNAFSERTKRVYQ